MASRQRWRRSLRTKRAMCMTGAHMKTCGGRVSFKAGFIWQQDLCTEGPIAALCKQAD